MFPAFMYLMLFDKVEGNTPPRRLMRAWSVDPRRIMALMFNPETKVSSTSNLLHQEHLNSAEHQTSSGFWQRSAYLWLNPSSGATEVSLPWSCGQSHLKGQEGPESFNIKCSLGSVGRRLEKSVTICMCPGTSWQLRLQPFHPSHLSSVWGPSVVICGHLILVGDLYASAPFG